MFNPNRPSAVNESRYTTLNDKYRFKYIVRGYDKDYDAYRNLYYVTSVIEAIRIMRILIEHHTHCDEIRNPDTKEPFDWFDIVTNNNQNSRITYGVTSIADINTDYLSSADDEIDAILEISKANRIIRENNEYPD